MAASIKIRYYTSDITQPFQGYLLKCEAHTAVDMSSKIFVFQRRVTSATDPQAAEEKDIFISIADPVDLEHYPEDTPDPGNNMPFYRSASVELMLRSTEEVLEVKDMIDTDVGGLVNALNASGQLEVMEEIDYA